MNLSEVLGRFRRKPTPTDRSQPPALPFDDGLVDLARLIDDSKRSEEPHQQHSSYT